MSLLPKTQKLTYRLSQSVFSDWIKYFFKLQTEVVLDIFAHGGTGVVKVFFLRGT